MGGYFSRNMMQKQSEMQKEMQERQMAMQLSRARDNCLWITTFTATAATALILGFRKTKKPVLLAPLFPLAFVTAFNWDLAYGSKISRIRQGAEHLLTNERDLLKGPNVSPASRPVDQ